MIIYNFCKRLVRRIRVYNRRFIETISKDRVLADRLEPKLLVLCRKLISDPDSEVYICPDSGHRYINNYNSNTFVIITPYSIKICSDTCQEIQICAHSHRVISQVFDARLKVTSQKVLDHFRTCLEDDFLITYVKHIK